MGFDVMGRLGALVQARGVSGDEGAVRRAICEQLPEGWSRQTDPLGNLIVRRAEQAGLKKPLLLVSAHMDEPGLLVETADEKGGIRFTAAGEIDPKVLAGRQVRIAAGERELSGVIGVKPIHVLTAKERETPVKPEALFIDIGAASQEEALSLVTPGDSVTFAGEVSLFGEGLICGRALESRSGCALLLELLHRWQELPWELAAVFTSQRRTGSAGMRTAAFRLQPQVCIVLESAPSAFGGEERSPELGKGPIVSLREKMSFYDRELYRLALKAAKELSVPVQQRTAAFSASDGTEAQLAGGGRRVLELAVPTRNPGTPCCIQSLADLEGCLRLLCGLTQRLKP